MNSNRPPPQRMAPPNNGNGYATQGSTYYPAPPPAHYAPPSQRPMLGVQPVQRRPGPPSPGLPSRPNEGQLPRPLQQRPQQQDFYPQNPPLQRQPSAPRPQLQRQPSAPEPRPNQYPPPSQPMPSIAPAVAGPSPALPTSDSQTTLYNPQYRANNMLIRGTSDDDLDKTDAFWRRFNASAVNAQQPDAEKSSWLEKNEGKSSRYYRLMWILAAGGIGLGVFLSFRNSNSNTRPDTIGGSADITSAGDIAATAAGGVPAAATTGTTTTSLHVSPTNTVA
ncbi:hypothetical protein C8F01DRAFT_1245761 [Mycena amicta]|nr:hypothetical protein C8F01DRAFT_1245761 [Mycena amicta]